MEKKNRNDSLKLIDEKLTAEAEQLNKYLMQYKYCISRKADLEQRRSEVLRLFEDPIGSVKLDGMPRGSSSGVGCAAISLRLDEINSMLSEQLESASKTLLDIMHILGFLPENSVEKTIIENKYIDLYDWQKICRKNHLGRSPAIRRWKSGIYMLLEMEEVRRILYKWQGGN